MVAEPREVAEASVWAVALGAALELNGGLEVIVGKGSHSGARGGVIGPMVKKMLNEHKVGWESEGGKVVIRWA